MDSPNCFPARKLSDPTYAFRSLLAISVSMVMIGIPRSIPLWTRSTKCCPSIPCVMMLSTFADNDQAVILFDRLISAEVDGIITQGIEEQHFVDLVHTGVERGMPILTFYIA